MKNILLLFISFLLNCIAINAQTWDMAKNLLSGAQSSGTSISTDAVGNMYVTGRSFYYSGGAGGGSYNYFKFWKFDPSGNVLWVDTLEIGDIKCVAEPNGDVYVAGGKVIKYDNSGNILWEAVNAIGGRTLDVSLNPLGGVVTTGFIPINDTSRSVFSRFDENGNCLWTKVNEFQGVGTHISCDGYGNTYIAGDAPFTSPAGNHGFLVKYNSSGALLYSVSLPHWVNGMSVDNMNNLYISGRYNNSYPVTIQGTIYTSAPDNINPNFLIKCDPAGNILWHRIFNGDMGQNIYIETDNTGNVYAAVNYTTFWTDSLNLNDSLPHGLNTVIIKMNSNGQILWHHGSTGNVDGASAYTSALNVTGDGSVFIAGSMKKTNSFDSYTLSTSSYGDLLIAKINSPVAGVASLSSLEVKELHIYPNPTQGFFQLNYTSSSVAKIKITVSNAVGKSVYSEEVQKPSNQFSKQIDLSKQSKGIYYIEVAADEKRSVEKIILN